MSPLNYAIAPEVEATAPPPSAPLLPSPPLWLTDRIPKAAAWGQTYLASYPASSASSTTSTAEYPGPLLNLSQGVPGDPPHSSVLHALAEASQDPQSARYGPIMGEPALRAAVAVEINHKYALDTSTSKEEDAESGAVVRAGDVGITTGCNMAFLALLHTLCTPHQSSLLIPVPSYFNNTMSMSLHSVLPVGIPCLPEEGFKPSLSAARKALGNPPKGKPIRGIILVSPNNPTGATYTPDELNEWFDLAKEFGVALMLDETYRDFVEGVPHRLFEETDWRSTLVCLGSFSKGYRIPGHRLGSIIASPYLLQRVATICDCMQICAPRPPQIALSSLLPSLRDDIASSSAALKHRRQLFVEVVHKVPGWKVISIGGFFAYVEFPPYVKEGKMGSEAVARYLAERCGVISLPGSFFMPSKEQMAESEGIEVLREDKWLRFAVANVPDEVIVQLRPRLLLLNELLGSEAS